MLNSQGQVPHLPATHLPASSLSANYAWCRRLCQQSQSSFFSSFALLDRPRRRAMYALYAFARTTDDLGDSHESVEDRRRALTAWQAQTLRALQPLLAAGPAERLARLEPYAPLWPALADSVGAFEIPARLLDDIICGVAMDLDHRPPQDWDALTHYCYHVASAVGLACTYIWRDGNEIPNAAAIDCGIAFQLTNILRDVAEDARVGRLYLPLSMLEEFGVDQTCWLAGRPNGEWTELLDHVAAEAHKLYASGWRTIDSLSPSSRRMFSLMWHSYRQLLSLTMADKRRLWEAPKRSLSGTQKMQLFIRHMLPPPLWPRP